MPETRTSSKGEKNKSRRLPPELGTGKIAIGIKAVLKELGLEVGDHVVYNRGGINLSGKVVITERIGTKQGAARLVQEARVALDSGSCKKCPKKIVELHKGWKRSRVVSNPEGYEFTKKQGYRPIINDAKLGASILQDIKSVIGGLYHMNAKYAIGYGFNKAKSGKEIAVGMFIDYKREIGQWEYYLDFKTGILSKLYGETMLPRVKH